MRAIKSLVVYTVPRSREQKSTFEIVKIALKKHKISCRLANRDRLRRVYFKDADFVIAVGGDGTFLRAAQFVDKQLLLGVNADTKSKEGFFMKSDKRDFERKLNLIIKNRQKIKRLPRLEAFINGKKISVLALNEFYIGRRKAYHSAKYVIMANGKKERQKSSGVLVATPAGSHAWAKSCCSKSLPLNSKKCQFVVREPYEGKVFKNYKLKYGTLGKSQEIIIFSEMIDGIIVADSVGSEYNLGYGSKASVKLSNNYLNAVWQ